MESQQKLQEILLNDILQDKLVNPDESIVSTSSRSKFLQSQLFSDN